MSSEREPARAGDTIKRKTDGQEFSVACDEEHGRVYTAGWPEASEDMELYDISKRATDEERIKMLEGVSSGRGGGGRMACAARQLHDIRVREELARVAAQHGGITEDVLEVTAWAKRKGWDQPPMCEVPGDMLQNSEPQNVNVEAVGMKLALIHSEITEALEELRKGPGHMTIRIDQNSKKPEGFVVELADAYIRMVHLCGMLGIDLETAVRIKQTFNETRSFRHGGKAA